MKAAMANHTPCRPKDMGKTRPNATQPIPEATTMATANSLSTLTTSPSRERHPQEQDQQPDVFTG
jgi:hypothetical protein